MKVKSVYRSKFSNLSNWKEEAWKISGLQRDCIFAFLHFWVTVTLSASSWPCKLLKIHKINCLFHNPTNERPVCRPWDDFKNCFTFHFESIFALQSSVWCCLVVKPMQSENKNEKFHLPNFLKSKVDLYAMWCLSVFHHWNWLNCWSW